MKLQSSRISKFDLLKNLLKIRNRLPSYPFSPLLWSRSFICQLLLECHCFLCQRLSYHYWIIENGSYLCLSNFLLFLPLNYQAIYYTTSSFSNPHSLLEQRTLFLLTKTNKLLQRGHFSPVGFCQRANLHSG